MSRGLVLLWLGTATAEAEHRPHLDTWAEARAVRLSAPRRGETPPSSHDDALASRLETLLAEARTAAGALDRNQARDRLDTAFRLLREHPELPEAAWLMAELLQLRGALQASSRLDTQATELQERARALEGPRARVFIPLEPPDGAAPVAEGSPEPSPSAFPENARDEVEPARLRIAGPRPGDVLHWNGRRITDTVPAVAGEHHVRVLRRNRLVWAGWIEVRAGKSTVRIPVPAPPSCSRDELEGALLQDGRVVAPAAVTCPHWAVARPRPGGGIEIAECRENRCRRPEPWHAALAPSPPAARQQADTAAGLLPGWLTWTLAGVGTAAATSFALWRTGVFDPRPTPNVVYTFTGPAAR